jgi:hypothetical protein
MNSLLAKPYAPNSNQANRKYVHDGRMYYMHRDLSGDNEGKILAECYQKWLLDAEGGPGFGP